MILSLLLGVGGGQSESDGCREGSDRTTHGDTVISSYRGPYARF